MNQQIFGLREPNPVNMHLFETSQVPVSEALGEAYAVVDTYHASAPCQTMPNRCFAQLGTATSEAPKAAGTRSSQRSRSLQAGAWLLLSPEFP